GPDREGPAIPPGELEAEAQLTVGRRGLLAPDIDVIVSWRAGAPVPFVSGRSPTFGQAWPTVGRGGPGCLSPTKPGFERWHRDRAALMPHSSRLVDTLTGCLVG